MGLLSFLTKKKEEVNVKELNMGQEEDRAAAIRAYNSVSMIGAGTIYNKEMITTGNVNTTGGTTLQNNNSTPYQFGSAGMDWVDPPMYDGYTDKRASARKLLFEIIQNTEKFSGRPSNPFSPNIEVTEFVEKSPLLAAKALNNIRKISTYMVDNIVEHTTDINMTEIIGTDPYKIFAEDTEILSIIMNKIIPNLSHISFFKKEDRVMIFRLLNEIKPILEYCKSEDPTNLIIGLTMLSETDTNVEKYRTDIRDIKRD